MSRSIELFNKAKNIIPGGVNSPVRAFNSVGGNPPFIERGKKQYLWDVDGNRYLDFLSSWGPLILGNRNKTVFKAVKGALKKGFSFGAPTPQEVELAELVTDMIPSIEKVRFVNSGTEAVMSAIRLARAYTGKDKIIKFDGCYHGHSDSLLVSAGSGMASKPASAGVTAGSLKDTISLPFNNKKALEDIFISNSQIAAVIVEPIPGNMGLVLPENGYLEFLREITKKHNTLLIFDEVISGFRASKGGAQELFNITPDLTTLGKIIGGGFPVGAYGGKKEIMSMVAPDGEMYQAGTLSGNPIAMAAGVAMLKELNKPGFHKTLNSKSNDFILSIKREVKDLPVTINSNGSLFTVFFNKDEVKDYETALKSDTSLFKIYFHKLLKAGIYISPSQFECGFISDKLSKKDLLNAKNIFVKAIKETIKGEV